MSGQNTLIPNLTMNGRKEYVKQADINYLVKGVALLAGGMLAFALSFDEIIVTTFTAGHERTLPLWLLNQLGRPRDVPVTNVVALLVMLVTTLPILGAWWLTREGDNGQ